MTGEDRIDVEPFVPPGATAQTRPPAGWYPDPAEQNLVRFWDGLSWTDQVTTTAALSTPPGVVTASVRGVTAHPGGSSSVGPVFGCGAVLALLAVIVAILALSMRHGASGGDGEEVATSMCERFVAARLQRPSSATFSGVAAREGAVEDTWTVTGSVDSLSVAGDVRRTGFTCTVEPAGNGYWHLAALRLTGS